MKLKLLTLFVFIIGVNSFGQLSRAFYGTATASNVRAEDLFVANNELYGVSVKESTAGNLHYAITKLVDGETSPYLENTVGSQAGTNYFVNGCGSNTTNEVVLSILMYTSGVSSKLHLFRIDLSNGNFLQDYEVPGTYRGGCTRSVQKGDSIITYLSTDAGIFTRISNNLNDLSGFSSKQVSTATLTYAGATLGRMTVDMIIVNGEEFAVVNDSLFKHDLSGNFTSTNVSSLQNINGTHLATNDQNEVVAFASNTYAHFANDLSSLGSGTFSGLGASTERYASMHFDNGKYVLYYPTFSTNQYDKVIVNPSFVVENVIVNSETPEFYPVNAITFNSKFYIAGTLFRSDLKHSAVIESNGLLQDLLFEEYNRNMYTANQRVAVGHVGRLLNDPSDGAGLKTKQGGAYKSIANSAGSAVIGKNGTLDTVGYSVTFTPLAELSVGPFVPQGNRTIDFIDKYNRSYYVNKQMIEDHITNVNNPSYVMPFAIRDWPGNGNTGIGAPAQLLPYFDQDDNGVYEPELGDYPKIYGDQCAVFIYHQKEEANPIGLECHEYVYSFDCDTSELMRNSFFVNRHYFARIEGLTDVIFGNFLDSDIGYYGDDYVGTHVDLGMVYGYNGDAFDETSGPSVGFGDYAPVLGMQTLLGAKLAADADDNPVGIGLNESANGYGFGDGTVDNEYFTIESSRMTNNSSFYPYSDPSTLKQSYVFYQGKYLDGSYPQTFGNDVRMQYFGASDPLHYASFGVDTGTQFTEEDEFNPTGDRRVYSGSGPGSLGADTVNIVTAFIVAHDTINAGFDERPLLFTYGQQLKNQFALNTAGCGSDFGFYTSTSNVGLTDKKAMEASIYPNPVKETLHVGLKGVDMEVVELVTLDGTTVYQNAKSTTSTTIDMTGLPSGIYLLRIESAQGSVTKKVVKL